MLRRRDPKYSLITMALDAAIATAAYLFSYWFRFSGRWIPLRDIPPLSEYAKVVLILVPILLFVFRHYRLYSVRSPLSRIDEAFTVIKATSLVFLIFMAVTFIYREYSYSRIVISITWFVSMAGILAGRAVVNRLESWEKAKRRADSHLLILGVNRQARKLIRRFRESPRFGYRVVGVLSQEKHTPGRHLEGLPLLGTLEDFDAAMEKYDVHEVILANPGLSREKTAEIMLKCESRMVGFRLVADFYGLVTSCVDIEYVSDVPLLGLKELPLDDAWNRVAKRAFDLLLSFLGLAVTLPLIGAIAAAVKLGDGGPVLYAQERVGQDGKVFKFLKFRTMKVNAEAGTGPVWAKENDERVTAMGRFLRKTSLDELPQLWNVLAGDMSLVGPRPERPHFVYRFRDMIPRYMARHKIKSGITGWAQVNGFRGNTSLKERVKYDLYYMENWSLLLDTKILFMTFSARAFKNAY
jgi:exopolysaccharide biosynthesis polyprenyl glycosylphosphotransferase